MSEKHLPRIKASIFHFLEDNIGNEVNIRWPGQAKIPKDWETWVEPWIEIFGIPSRKRDWLFDIVFQVNVFSKLETKDIYSLDKAAGKVANAFKAQNVKIYDFDEEPFKVKGLVRFQEPETSDVGQLRPQTRGVAAGVGLRQAVVRFDARIFSLES